MKVQIVKAGTYGDFRHIKMGAREYEVGEVVTWPDWYAQKLLAQGIAIEIPAIAAMTEPVVVLSDPLDTSANSPVGYPDVLGADEASVVDIPISVPYFGDEGAAISNDEFAFGSDKFKEINVTGQARLLAVELGLDLSTVEGTGRGGRITVKDVRAAEPD